MPDFYPLHSLFHPIMWHRVLLSQGKANEIKKKDYASYYCCTLVEQLQEKDDEQVAYHNADVRTWNYFFTDPPPDMYADEDWLTPASSRSVNPDGDIDGDPSSFWIQIDGNDFNAMSHPQRRAFVDWYVPKDDMSGEPENGADSGDVGESRSGSGSKIESGGSNNKEGENGLESNVDEGAGRDCEANVEETGHH